MDDFLYINLISTFFVDNVLLHSRSERLQNAFEYVLNKKFYSSETIRDKIKKSIGSVDMTFMKKWRSSGCTDIGRFKQENEAWVNTALQVQVYSKTYFFRKRCKQHSVKI